MEKDIIVKKSTELIAKYLGEITAGMYKEHFMTLDEQKIIPILEELLLEVIGPDNAKKQIESLLKL